MLSVSVVSLVRFALFEYFQVFLLSLFKDNCVSL